MLFNLKNKGSLSHLAFSLVLLLTVAAGCSAGASEEADNVIKVLDAATYGGESKEALTKMYNLYEKNNPEYELKQVSIPDVSAALTAGAATDLIMLDPFQAKESFKADYIEPLNKGLKDYQFDEKFFGWAINSYKYKDKYIGIPWNYEGLLLFYNKTMFEKNGWEVPTNYKELLSLSKKMKQKGIMPFAMGSSDVPGVNNWWATSIVNGVLGPEGTKKLFSGDVKWTDPRLVDAFKRFSEYWNAGYITDKKSHAVSYENSLQLFATEEAAMRLDGTWSLSSVDPDFEVGFAPFPSWKRNGDPVIPVGVGGGFAVNAKSKHKEEVIELLSYFTNEQVTKIMAQHGIPQPIKTDFGQMDLKPKVKGALNVVDKAMKEGKNGYVSWSYASPSVINNLENGGLAGVYLKKTTVLEWLQQLQKLKEKDAAEGVLVDLSNY